MSIHGRIALLTFVSLGFGDSLLIVDAARRRANSGPGAAVSPCAGGR